MIKNTQRREGDRSFSRLEPIDTKMLKRIVLNYEPSVNQVLKKYLKTNDVEIVNRNNNKLRALLGSAKDRTKTMEKSGIYEISCKDCEKTYVGQTCRQLQIRYKEHLAHWKHDRKAQSAVAMHMITENHSFSVENVKLLKEVQNQRYLNATETLYITNGNNLMNLFDPPINSILFGHN